MSAIRMRPVLALLLALLVPFAFAGSPEAPELADAAGDCTVPYGSEYLDIVSAWISDETEADFQVNLALAKFNDAVAEGAGYTVQFTHQGVTWGIIATYSGALNGGDGWAYVTGQAEANKVEAEGFEETSGSFTAGEPAVIHAKFPKGIFPHADATDNALRGFWAASADLRPAYPFFFAEEAAPGSSNGKWVLCDEATGDGVYTFQSGQHASHGGGAGPASTEDEADAEAGSTAGNGGAPTPPAQPADASAGGGAEAGTPGFGGALALAAAAGASGILGRLRQKA